MPIVVVGNEKNFAALRPRLFGDKVSRTEAREVADAIQEANPHADLDKLTPGTVLIVPDSPIVRVRGELALDEPTVKGVEGLGQLGKQALDGLAEAANRRTAEARKERARVLKAIESFEARTDRPKDTRLTKNLKSARQALEGEDDRAQQRAAKLAQAQAEWEAGLDALRERASRLLPTR
jgi:hypothetical protein